jgi:Ribbon-helix-helix protein, copG family
MRPRPQTLAILAPDEQRLYGMVPVTLYTALYMPATRTQVYLTQEQRDRIEELRARDGRTLAQVIRAALDAYLTPREPTLEELQHTLDETFGSMPDLETLPRGEWDRLDFDWNRIERDPAGH